MCEIIELIVYKPNLLIKSKIIIKMWKQNMWRVFGINRKTILFIQKKYDRFSLFLDVHKLFLNQL